MKTGIMALMILALAVAARAQFIVTTTVPGTSNPYLAGMPAGSGADGDTAPAESPVLVNLPVTGGAVYEFSASGSVANDSVHEQCSPDGGCDGFPRSGRPGATNGIANIVAPLNCLLGVFLDPNVPSGFSPPATLDFSNAVDQDFLVLRPALRQPFFIGDGLTSGGDVQQFIAPPGATRLFLATMDGITWNDNVGSFTVTVTNSLAPPVITGITVHGPTLTLTATNLLPGQPFVLLTSPDLTLPLGQWSPLLTNAFDTNGALNLSTNVIAPANREMFYLLQEP